MTVSEKQMLNQALYEALSSLMEAQAAVRTALWTLNNAEQETDSQENDGTE